MSKIDELRSDYNRGFWSVPETDGLQAQQNAGIAAVIRALRDEFGRIMYPGDDWNRQGILEQFDQILATSEGGQAAGGPTREDGRTTDAGFDSLPADVEPLTPAATAPVCVWTKYMNGAATTSCQTIYCLEVGDKKPGDDCPLCWREIKFTEAQR